MNEPFLRAFLLASIRAARATARAKMSEADRLELLMRTGRV